MAGNRFFIGCFGFSEPDHVPWQLINRWNNMQVLLRDMHFIVTHIYREGNEVVDCLANHGLFLQNFNV